MGHFDGRKPQRMATEVEMGENGVCKLVVKVFMSERERLGGCR